MPHLVILGSNEIMISSKSDRVKTINFYYTDEKQTAHIPTVRTFYKMGSQ